MKQHHITQIAINLHYKPWSIVRYLKRGNHLGVRLLYSFEDRLLGSAGAARRLTWFFNDGPFLVFYGDLYTNLDISTLIAEHHKSEALITMALYEVDNPTACGIVELDEQNRVTRFVEKPAHDQVFSRLANAGVFVVEPAVLDLIPRGAPYDFGHDLFSRMLGEGLSIQGFKIDDLLIDIGTPENYKRAQRIAACQTVAI